MKTKCLSFFVWEKDVIIQEIILVTLEKGNAFLSPISPSTHTPRPRSRKVCPGHETWC